MIEENGQRAQARAESPSHQITKSVVRKISHSKKSYLVIVKLPLFICISLLLFSCSTGPVKNSPDSIPAADTVPVPFAIATTALPVDPAPLPPPFILDSLSLDDTAKHLHTFFYFPSTPDKKLNELIIQLVKKNASGYEDYHPREYETASVEAWVSSFAVTGKLVSMCFTDQSFSTGAAHFNHGYTSLNYDTLKRKEVFLTDIFNLRTEKEKQNFCDSILSPDINTDLRIEAAGIRKNTDFIIEKGNLIFFFDDYEKGPSMCTYIVSLQSLRTFLRTDYQFLLQ